MYSPTWETHIPSEMCCLPGKHISLVLCVSLPGKHISLVKCIPLPGKHISLVICVPLPQKHKFQVICVPLPGKHIQYVAQYPDGTSIRTRKTKTQFMRHPFQLSVNEVSQMKAEHFSFNMKVLAS